MKKLIVLALAAVLALSAVSALAISVAVPNDTTNEARALLLLQANGYIKLKDGVDITATVADIEENPNNLEFQEVEAAMVPNIKADVDYAIINNNYALDAGLSPTGDSLLIESAESPYVNVLTVKEGNEDAPATKALIAAVTSTQVADYIAAIAKDILAAKDITLEIIEFSDYVQPNMVVEAGEVYANYFAHIPYQENFNQENGTHLVNVAGIHVEPMALYGGKQADLSALTK